MLSSAVIFCGLCHTQRADNTLMIDKKLLDILVCPVSKAALTYNKAHNELFCLASGLAYPVREGIPILLKEEARELTAEELHNKASS